MNRNCCSHFQLCINLLNGMVCSFSHFVSSQPPNCEAAERLQWEEGQFCCILPQTLQPHWTSRGFHTVLLKCSCFQGEAVT